jgi:hypothetical protein
LGETASVTFGQQTGPPATSSQIRELLTLLHDAGHDGFRAGRGPMGFTQRQAGGKFTRDEATSFIDQLQDAQHAGTPVVVARASRPSPTDQLLRRTPDDQLVAELERRGWSVTKP